MSWKKIIEAAEKRGSFTQSEKHKAGEWSTCAVGEITKGRIERFKTNDPLIHWGIKFDAAVHGDHIDEAKKIHAKIQKAAAK